MSNLKNGSKKDGPSKAEEHIGEMLNEILIASFVGAGRFLRYFSKKKLNACLVMPAIVLAVWYFTKSNGLIWLMNTVFSGTINGKTLDWFLSVDFNVYLWVNSILAFLAICFPWGLMHQAKMNKYKRLFESIGLKNKAGKTPTVISVTKTGEKTSMLLLAHHGITLTVFDKAQEALIGMFGKNILFTRSGFSFRNIEIHMTTERLEDRIKYFDLMDQLEPDHFIVGKSLRGLTQVNITDLPHMLICGATGTGKSNFYKQMLTGLLTSSNHLQMYLIDLKNGLEASYFSDAPNVKIAKSADAALQYLRKIRTEMYARFKYMEDHRLTEIDPSRDQKDRIVIAIDEAAVLYATPSKTNPDYEKIMEARRISDEIARLSRAAAIHLILSTQKVSKETVDTSMQENISARMCFKLNTLQGSIIAIGNKNATELPTIKGRGIWAYGAENETLQTPSINKFTIYEACKFLQLNFESGKKSLHSKMISIESSSRKVPKGPTVRVDSQDPQVQL